MSRGSSELVVKLNDNEEYAIINKNIGDARFEAKIIKNNIDIIAKARGALIKGPNKRRIIKDDYVLIQENEGRYYVIHKYSSDDVKKLSKMGELKMITTDMTDTGFDIKFDDDDQIEFIAEEINEDFIANI